ncbi:MAG: hypothetical protein H6Q43_859, partial [Deltaproteobacteria bacterium]|nr:hypothetical protein [Deltaproteobacteria bacterium]
MKFSFRSLRILVQSLSFLFLLYLILQAAFPLEIKIPVDLYLRLSPFIGIISLVAQKEFIWRMLPSFGVLLLVIILGNFFCGWFCPMGAAIDFFDRIFFREKKRKAPFNDQALRRGRYGIFLFALAAGLMGWQLMFLLDPISLITRTLVIAVHPPAVYIANQLIPFIQKFLPESPLILSTSPLPVYKVNFLIFLFFVIILSLGVIRRRFWCRYLCPLGTLFSLTSRLRLFRRSVSPECIHCLKCVKECPVGAIPEEKPETYRQQDCITCLRCTDCPPKAVSFGMEAPRWQSAQGVSLSRRYLVGSIGLGLFSTLVVKTNPLQTGSGRRNNRLIRPPGALAEEKFVSACTGCGECLKVCPNNALQATFLEAGLAGFYTPRLVPRIGYCEEHCNFCGRVCPTEAIRHLPPEEKRLVQMGVAHIDKTRCIAFE